jgi:hypothetical protein
MPESTGKKCKVCGGGIVSENLTEPVEVRPSSVSMIRGPGGDRGRVTAQTSTKICYCRDCGIQYYPPVVLRKK